MLFIAFVDLWLTYLMVIFLFNSLVFLVCIYFVPVHDLL